MEGDTVKRIFSGSDTGKEILAFAQADMEVIPVVLASTQCLLDPTEENLTHLRSMSVTFQSLGILASCTMGSLPDQPMNGIEVTIANGLIRNAESAANLLQGKPILFAQNRSLVIENLSKDPFPENYTAPGVSGKGGTGIGMTIINAFACYANIHVTYEQRPSGNGSNYTIKTTLPLASLLH